MKKLLSFMLAAIPVLAHAATVDEGTAAMAEGRYPAAIALLEPLATAGDGQAEYLLGTLYDAGLGAPQNHAKAFGLYVRSASRHNPNGYFVLAEGFKHSPTVACAWYAHAVTYGHRQAAAASKALGCPALAGQTSPTAPK